MVSIGAVPLDLPQCVDVATAKGALASGRWLGVEGERHKGFVGAERTGEAMHGGTARPRPFLEEDQAEAVVAGGCDGRQRAVGGAAEASQSPVMKQVRSDGAQRARRGVGVGREAGEIEVAPTAGVVDLQRVVGRVDLEAIDVAEGIAEASGELG